MTIELTDRQRDILLGELEDRLSKFCVAIANYRASYDRAIIMQQSESFIHRIERFIISLEKDVDSTKALIKQLEEGKK